jgi:hypothetical protein
MQSGSSSTNRIQNATTTLEQLNTKLTLVSKSIEEVDKATDTMAD